MAIHTGARQGGARDPSVGADAGHGGDVRILFDQGTPVPLRRAFDGHIVETVFERGWSQLENGAVIQSAESLGFDVYVTTDKNLRYQQKVTARR